MEEVIYRHETRLSARELADIFRRSGIKRPVDDLPRLEKMLEHGNLLATA